MAKTQGFEALSLALAGDFHHFKHNQARFCLLSPSQLTRVPVSILADDRRTDQSHRRVVAKTVYHAYHYLYIGGMSLSLQTKYHKVFVPLNVVTVSLELKL